MSSLVFSDRFLQLEEDAGRTRRKYRQRCLSSADSGGDNEKASDDRLQTHAAAEGCLCSPPTSMAAPSGAPQQPTPRPGPQSCYRLASWDMVNCSRTELVSTAVNVGGAKRRRSIRQCGLGQHVGWEAPQQLANVSHPTLQHPAVSNVSILRQSAVWGTRSRASLSGIVSPSQASEFSRPRQSQ